MSVQLLERVMALGKELGYTGVELREWVTAQIKVEETKEAESLAREERRFQREEYQRQTAEKAQADLRSRQDAKSAEEAERLEKLKRDEMALEHAKLEQEERLKRMELDQQKELKLAELKLAEKKLDNGEGDSGSESDANASEASASSTRARRGKAGPRLPPFDENKDNIDSYLRRFERYATLQQWPDGDWATYLSALLKGKALEVYSRLSETEARSYLGLKAALLRKYQLTVEGFRKQFYSSRREREETLHSLSVG